MSEPAFEYDDGGGGGFDPAAVDDGPGEYTGPSREEWDQAQAQLAEASELVQAVQSQSQREQAAEMYAQRDEWLGDPLDDPTGYAERVQQLARMEMDARVAPLQAWVEEQAEVRENAYFNETFSATLATEAQAAGVELSDADEGHASAAIEAELEKVIVDFATEMLQQTHLRYGLPVDEQAKVAAINAATERLTSTPGAFDTAVRWYVAQKVRQARPPGDELSIVARHLGGPRGGSERPARARYASARDEQLAASVLGRL